MILQQWESLLAPYLSRIKLLGEIPLERSEHAELESAIGEFIRQYG